MTILIPLTIILAGFGYLLYQTYYQYQQHKKDNQRRKQLFEFWTKETKPNFSRSQPLAFDWRDHLLMKIFGQKTWIRYRQGYMQARFAINYFYPTGWVGLYCLFSILVKLLVKVFWQIPLNWFFWLSLAALPICGLILFCQLQKIKQIPVNERRKNTCK